MMIPKAHIYINSTLLHFTQLIAGFELLKEKKKIDLSYSICENSYPPDIIRVDYKGVKLFFDLADNSQIRKNLYVECDFYVKRMLLKTDLKKKSKLISYGLNYPVFYENKYIRKLVFKKHFIKYALRYYHSISGILNIKNSIRNTHLKHLHCQPSSAGNVIFRTRLWNPDNNKEIWKKQERKKMNKERIDINNLLYKVYGDQFIGGIEEDEFSRKKCSNLLLTSKDYHKKNYLKSLKKSSIGIVNQGLEDSIGWKFGEYVAHGMAILTTPINDYFIHGNFREAHNYLTFNNNTELLEQINRIQSNKELLYNIQYNNYCYYKEYLEPPVKILKILKEIDGKL